MRAAVPAYLGTGFAGAPPGHRFRLYLEVWDDRWGLEKSKKEALSRLLDTRPFMEGVESLRQRQRGLALPSDLVVDATSTAPFVTGMGMEHPLENGFAFLDPYGLPYLPGSSVKGVVRRAAEELALFEGDPKGWTLPAVWWFFGFDASSAFLAKGDRDEPAPVAEERRRWREAYRDRGASGSQELVHALVPHVLDDEARRLLEREGGGLLEVLPRSEPLRGKLHLRGSVELWDVLPKPAGAALRVDIMNPHHGHYYQGGEPPHDAGSPNPVFFLTVPEGSELTFIARLRPVGALPHELAASWKGLLTAAFEHAFAWLGFGAKTSLGYGAMARDREAERAADEQARHRAAEQAERRRRDDEGRRLAAMSPADRLVDRLRTADNEAVAEAVRALDELSGEDLRTVASALKQRMLELGIWKVPPKKQKQHERMLRVRRALGEIEK